MDSKKWLAIFDLSGIQRFIFATNKMKEIIGGSTIVHNALFKELPDIIGNSPDNWQTDDFKFNGAEAQIVYIGGGNALVIFSSEDKYKETARELGKRVFLNSGGALKLTSACVELDEIRSLSDNQKALMAKLDSAKKAGGNTSSFGVLPIISYDNNNYEPLVLTDSHAMPLSKQKKLEAEKNSTVFNDIKPNENNVFALDFESTRKAGEKNYQAIIHIDGNTMGIKIREYVKNLKGDLKGDIEPQLNSMRILSRSISSIYKDTVKETIKRVFKDEVNLDFRPIVIDGDDVTVMMPSVYAFDFVKEFMDILASKEIKSLENFKPTAAAGVAFVTLKFPFSVAYGIAESCCKNAKAKTIERCGGSEKFLANPVSSIDYQVCYSNISENLPDYRNRYFRFSDYTLLRRPYTFDNGDYSFNSFMSECDFFNSAIKANNIARSKLKGLRNAYGISVTEAELYGSYIHSHQKTPGEKEPADKLQIPFNDKKEAKFFDYLDVIDIAWKGEKR